MVWVAIWKGGKSELIFMERDEDSLRQGYSFFSYIWALEEGLLPALNSGGAEGRLFQQDGASIHRSRDSLGYLESHGIEPIDWPPYSPDLNPIEHVWKRLKELVYQMHPEFQDLKENEADKELAKAWIKEAWDAIDPDFIGDLLDSIPRRRLAVRRARGWYTKY